MYLVDEWDQLVLPEEYDEEAGHYVKGGYDPRGGQHSRTHPVLDPRPRHTVDLSGFIGTSSQESKDEVNSSSRKPLKPLWSRHVCIITYFGISIDSERNSLNSSISDEERRAARDLCAEEDASDFWAHFCPALTPHESGL